METAVSPDLVPYIPADRRARPGVAMMSVVLLAVFGCRIVFGPDPVLFMVGTVVTMLLALPAFNWWSYRSGAEMISLEERALRNTSERGPFWYAVVPYSLLYGAFMGLYFSTRYPPKDAEDLRNLVGISIGLAILMGLVRALFEWLRRRRIRTGEQPLALRRYTRFEAIASVIISIGMTFGFGLVASSLFIDRMQAAIAFFGGFMVGAVVASALHPRPSLSAGLRMPTFPRIFGLILLVLAWLGAAVAVVLFTANPEAPATDYLAIAGLTLVGAPFYALFLWAMVGAVSWTPSLKR